MLALGPIGFTAPWLLIALVALPALWFLLRAIPPAPVIRRFPGVALLLGLQDEDSQADRTPWWLLVLRLLAVALVILGFAGPVLNPERERPGTGPLLIVVDGSWADARDWRQKTGRISAELGEAGRAGRRVALVSLTDLPPEGPVFQSADAVAAHLPALTPRAWEPAPDSAAALAAALPDMAFESLWLSDGLAREGRAALAEALRTHGALWVVEGPRNILGLGAAEYASGQVAIDVRRARTEGAETAGVIAHGLDPAGIERQLAQAEAAFPAGEDTAVARFELPSELRNRITRFAIAGEHTAGAVSLTDDALKRRKVALVVQSPGREGAELLSPDHFLRQALAPTADLIDGTLEDVLKAGPDVIILADLAKVPDPEALSVWVENGGLLVRFAGRHLAASDIGREALDPLLPVRLRIGGRAVGGTMSWGEPKQIAPFSEASPFFGLKVPPDVTVSAQILAQPGPDLAKATIAELADGTPLVTRRQIGDGSVVLFHISANAEWSSLALSGLFVEMLERLAVASGGSSPEPGDLDGTIWEAVKTLDAEGALQEAGDMAGLAGEALVDARPGPDVPPGLYVSGERYLAVNALTPRQRLEAARWAPEIAVEGLTVRQETRLKGWALAAALVLLMVDAVATLALSGRIGGVRRGLAMLGAVLLVPLAPGAGRAQQDPAALIRAADHVVLAYVRTGDAETDEISNAGLWGLSEVLYARSSVEPVEPYGVDLEADDLSVLTFLYWPVRAEGALPSAQAYAKLNRYLRTGGMILFDTRDADVAGFGAATPEGRRLQALAARLDVPPLEPVPRDHVLTRAFYLLQDFPGRYTRGQIWVEAAPPDAELAEGMPFRNLNDNVTPVVIGGNDWARAWAVTEDGRPMFPVGRGFGGDRQREMAYRFGVNLIMYVLTGNYKSDQVHVPALLERLGQ